MAGLVLQRQLFVAHDLLWIDAILVNPFRSIVMKVASLPRTLSGPSATLCPERLGGNALADLRSSAIQSLEANPIFRGRMALGAIQIESNGDTLVLTGKVPSYYLKQLLQESVRHLKGVRHIDNQVVVLNPGD